MKPHSAHVLPIFLAILTLIPCAHANANPDNFAITIKPGDYEAIQKDRTALSAGCNRHVEIEQGNYITITAVEREDTTCENVGSTFSYKCEKAEDGRVSCRAREIFAMERSNVNWWTKSEVLYPLQDGNFRVVETKISSYAGLTLETAKFKRINRNLKGK